MHKIKLGICVVYYYDNEELIWLLNLHLSEILKNTSDINFVIYAAVNRLQKDYLSILKNKSHSNKVEVVPLPSLRIKGAEEHGIYLDQLIKHAIKKDCSHVCTLDCDSWPIKKKWAFDIINFMKEKNTEIASVLRTELNDFWLPHPCAMIMSREFIEKYKPSMWPQKSHEDFRLFVKKTNQRMDTGIGVGYLIYKNQIKWLKFERSNMVNEHYLMAGIYGNYFFHLGASSRLKVFHDEFKNTFAKRTTNILRKLPLLWRYSSTIEKILLKIFPPLIHYNNRVYKNIIFMLQKDPHLFYSHLGLN